VHIFSNTLVILSMKSEPGDDRLTLVWSFPLRDNESAWLIKEALLPIGRAVGIDGADGTDGTDGSNGANRANGAGNEIWFIKCLSNSRYLACTSKVPKLSIRFPPTLNSFGTLSLSTE
jgi:hypothetical protein